VRDNQDHAIVFCGGEYPQPIDALRGVRRFVISLENSRNTLFLVKARARNGDTRSSRKLQWLSPVHIPSENIGFFGRYYYWERTDLRYHDGWRGSVSKAHNGLHLDEDIFAGMKAFRRGGRIQDSEDCRAARAATLVSGPFLISRRRSVPVRVNKCSVGLPWHAAPLTLAHWTSSWRSPR
jgi:hypothetical protein